METLAEFVQNKREKIGLSTIGLADRAGIPLSFIEDVESGKELFLSVNQRQKLARVLKCSPNDIKKYGIDIVAMGSDWEGDERFEKLREFCDVQYTHRSGKYSSTNFRKHVDEYTYDKKDEKVNDDEFTQLAIKDMNLIASVKYDGYEKDITKLKKLVNKWVDTNIVSMINDQGEVPLEESPMDELLKIEESINKKVKKHLEQNQK